MPAGSRWAGDVPRQLLRPARAGHQGAAAALPARRRDRDQGNGGAGDLLRFRRHILREISRNSVRMVSDKVRDIAATGARTVLAGDLGCLLNIAGRLPGRAAGGGAPCRRSVGRNDGGCAADRRAGAPAVNFGGLGTPPLTPPARGGEVESDVLLTCPLPLREGLGEGETPSASPTDSRPGRRGVCGLGRGSCFRCRRW